MCLFELELILTFVLIVSALIFLSCALYEQHKTAQNIYIENEVDNTLKKVKTPINAIDYLVLKGVINAERLQKTS